MPFTPYAIEKFISQRVAEVTENPMRDVASEFPDFENWISSYGIRVVLQNHVKEELHHVALQLLRRTFTALIHYRSACQSLKEHVAAGGTKWSPYFLALGYVEDSVGQLYQALDCSRKVLGQTLFKKNDGSKEQRLNEIYNSMRHEPARDEQPIWISQPKKLDTQNA